MADIKLLDKMYRASINERFVANESRNRDTVDFKKCYVDVAGKDLQSGLLLSQIIYWFLPDKNDHTKLRVIKDGKLWLAKRRKDWWDEIRISPRQFDRAIKILEREGLIETKVYKFSGVPTKHLQLNWDKLSESIDAISPFGNIGNNEDVTSISPVGNMNVTEDVISLTETTAQTTTKKKREVFQPEQEPTDPQAYADSLSPSKLGHFLMESVNRLHRKYRGRSMYSGNGSKWERDVLVSVYENCVQRKFQVFEFLFGEWFRRWETLKCLEWARKKGEPVATVPSMSYISKSMQYLHDEVMGKDIVKHNAKFADADKDSAEISPAT